MNANQQPSSVNDAAAIAPETAERIRAALRKSPNQMTLQLARDLGVPEAEVIRCFPDGRAVELDITRWEEILRARETERLEGGERIAVARRGLLDRVAERRLVPPPEDRREEERHRGAAAFSRRAASSHESTLPVFGRGGQHRDSRISPP